ncbi:hypothetical protein ACUUL3_04960 [Thiovibrio sp. JS02]
MLSKARVDYFPYLLKVIEEQGRLHSCEYCDEERDNLRDACNAVSPTNHEELAFVAAIGPKLHCQNLVNEYVRRRDGQQSKIYDHPLLALETWGTPDTHRILIYREQILALIKELTGVSSLVALSLFYKSLQSKPDAPPWGAEQFSAKYQNLPSEEVDSLHELIRYYGQRSMPYAWCSTMASRAELLAVQDVFR